MRAYRLLPIVAGILLTACSSQYDKPDGSYEYKDIEENDLVIPSELSTPDTESRYQVPELRNSEEGFVGDEISIRPPRQLLSVAPGSRVESASDESVIYIDTVEGIPDLRTVVWRHMIQVVEDLEVSYELDEENNRIVTDRFTMLQHERLKPGFTNVVRGVKIVTESAQVFEIIFQVAGHGRSGALYVNVSDPQWYVDGELQALPMHAHRTLERNLLNDISIALEQNFRANREVIAPEQIDVATGSTVNDDPAYIIETDFNSAWVLMPEALNNLGFEVDDLNQTDGIYYATYEPFGNRAWYHIFAFWRDSEFGPLGLEDGTEVTFVIDDRNERVYITPEIDDVAISEEQLEAWHPLVISAFRNEQNP